MSEAGKGMLSFPIDWDDDKSLLRRWSVTILKKESF